MIFLQLPNEYTCKRYMQARLIHVHSPTIRLLLQYNFNHIRVLPTTSRNSRPTNLAIFFLFLAVSRVSRDKNRLEIDSPFVASLSFHFWRRLFPKFSLQKSWNVLNENEGFFIIRYFVRSELKFTSQLERLTFCFNLFLYSLDVKDFFFYNFLKFSTTFSYSYRFSCS